MYLSVTIEDSVSSEANPVEHGMLCDGMATVNPRLLARLAEATLRAVRTGTCESVTVTLHPRGCSHGVVS